MNNKTKEAIIALAEVMERYGIEFSPHVLPIHVNVGDLLNYEKLFFGGTFADLLKLIEKNKK